VHRNVGAPGPYYRPARYERTYTDDVAG